MNTVQLHMEVHRTEVRRCFLYLFAWSSGFLVSCLWVALHATTASATTTVTPRAGHAYTVLAESE